MTKKPFSRVGDRSWRPKSRVPASASVPSPLCYAGGGRPPSKGLDFVRPFSRSADLERARLCPRLIKWFLRPSGSKRPFGVERDMLFILSGFLFYGVREKRRAEPSAVALGAALIGSQHEKCLYSQQSDSVTNLFAWLVQEIRLNGNPPERRPAFEGPAAFLTGEW